MLRATEEEVQKLHNFPVGVGGITVGGDIFTPNIGRFWDTEPTLSCMWGRMGMVRMLNGIWSVQSVEAQLDCGMEMLRLCRSDNVGVRGLIPSMMLRLHRDQECYDFIKWWAVVAKDPQYDFRNLDLPYLDIKDADVFEPVDFCFGYDNLNQMVALMLLKVKLLLDLTAMRTLEKQINRLYWEVHRINKWMWMALRAPEHFIDILPPEFSPGSMQEMKFTLSWSLNSWLVTPGTLDFIQRKIDEEKAKHEHYQEQMSMMVD
ncbi:hypothetical protein P168DRAFT_240836 [Aspergillus campestris IBT 28561]|uniref:Uncharacterized protein n=1 Tax=Aspergillus campestris (strain IBT 28561) TaxID=1392248 RepID=A0A2I1CWL2_ASPC2|nr:uncharacterized protein P168DRAFT_240836 [Aspergillus campestris IBT 28561]PKY02008.1 hypothetical protein P168DRAFT_240836 [Aspergillus campestris IBT 28561]